MMPGLRAENSKPDPGYPYSFFKPLRTTTPTTASSQRMQICDDTPPNDNIELEDVSERSSAPASTRAAPSRTRTVSRESNPPETLIDEDEAFFRSWVNNFQDTDFIPMDFGDNQSGHFGFRPK